MAAWLPLFHDMGLIGFFLLPMALGIETMLASPREFFRDPAFWMESISRYRATITGAPNFAYAIAGARLAANQADLDLSSLRLAFNGAEPIDPDAVEGFIAAASLHGFDVRAMFCVYGLAEATLAVTFPEPGSGLETDVVDSELLARSGRAVSAASRAQRRLVRLGKPIPGVEIRIAGADGGLLADRDVGEIEIRGKSTTLGYLGRPADSAALFRDGWLRTGDLGYLIEDDLVVCGRLKDLVIVGGRNILPEDIERAAVGSRNPPWECHRVSRIPGTTTERVVIVAERRGLEAQRAAVDEAVRESVDVSPYDVVFVRPGSLPKTSSGKLQRAECRRRYQTDELEVDD